MSIRPFDQILSIEDLKITAERLGNHFFDADSMRFFDSRVSEQLFWVDGSRGYFVTSERQEDRPRYWTVRSYEVFTLNGHDVLITDHVGEFQGWTRDGAVQEAEKLQGFAKLDIDSFDMER